ncbi:MAG: hypothetical protein LBS00_08550 [Synergistaceae bacterium]|jgi:hypothetical protein|nr:hypothetical protein [Synergistaceae bacterium]
MRKENEETNRKMKATDIRFGALDNRFGELAEHLVEPSIMEKFNALGFHFTDISTGRRKIISGKDKQTVAEFDILMENGESSVGVEVKAKPFERDVKDHVRRLEIFRCYKDTIGDKRKIYGALAGAIMPPSVKAFIPIFIGSKTSEWSLESQSVKKSDDIFTTFSLASAMLISIESVRDITFCRGDGYGF